MMVWRVVIGCRPTTPRFFLSFSRRSHWRSSKIPAVTKIPKPRNHPLLDPLFFPMADDFVTRAQYDELVDVVENLVEQMTAVQERNAELERVASSTQEELAAAKKKMAALSGNLSDLDRNVNTLQDSNAESSEVTENQAAILAAVDAVRNLGPVSWEPLQEPFQAQTKGGKINLSPLDLSPGDWVRGYVCVGGVSRGSISCGGLAVSLGHVIGGSKGWTGPYATFQLRLDESLSLSLVLHTTHRPAFVTVTHFGLSLP